MRVSAFLSGNGLKVCYRLFFVINLNLKTNCVRIFFYIKNSWKKLATVKEIEISKTDFELNPKIQGFC